MKGKTILTAAYDRLLYSYIYFENYVNEKIDQFYNYRQNVKWIKKNGGPYRSDRTL